MRIVSFFLFAVFFAGISSLAQSGDPDAVKACTHPTLHSLYRPDGGILCVTLVQKYEDLTADKINACEEDTVFWEALDYCLKAATSKYVTKEKIAACSDTTDLKSSFEKCLDGAGYYAVSADGLRSCHYNPFYKDCIDKLISGGGSTDQGATH